MDWIARLYFRKDGKEYRVKVFAETVGIERQYPRESNLLFSRFMYPVYRQESEFWYFDELDRLITTYESQIVKENEVNE